MKVSANQLGILAFGSLIKDPGVEIGPRIASRKSTQTPFRLSLTRGRAPTLVPHTQGGPVSAEILVLDNAVTQVEATDMLWRRETRNERSGKRYPGGNSPNSVLVAVVEDFGGGFNRPVHRFPTHRKSPSTEPDHAR